MPNSLFIEYHEDGLAFYINGDLQFDTVDEAIYHEYLVIPTIALAIKRFPDTNLKVLVCGGGDGLAVRECLRFAEVTSIDLVDYDAEVIKLARSVLKPYNKDSLSNSCVTVKIQEAFEFINACPDNFYHIVICDFTYPTSQEDTFVYSQEWFKQLNRVTVNRGIIASNGVSPENRTTAFWCLYKTILSAQFCLLPLQVTMPSFKALGYGNWGLLMASNQLITKQEIASLVFPSGIDYVTVDFLFKSCKFKQCIAEIRNNVTINTLANGHFFYYLLNPNYNIPKYLDISLVDFLELNETENYLTSDRNFLQLESIAQSWLSTLNHNSNSTIDIHKLLPIQHRYHTPKMNQEWLNYCQHLLAEINLEKLLNSVLKHSQNLSHKTKDELTSFLHELQTNKNKIKLNKERIELLMLVTVVLLTANLVAPDAVFAKGFGGEATDSTNYYNINRHIDYEAYTPKVIGLMLIFYGSYWLFDIIKRSEDD